MPEPEDTTSPLEGRAVSSVGKGMNGSEDRDISARDVAMIVTGALKSIDTRMDRLETNLTTSIEGLRQDIYGGRDQQSLNLRIKNLEDSVEELEPTSTKIPSLETRVCSLEAWKGEVHNKKTAMMTVVRDSLIKFLVPFLMTALGMGILYMIMIKMPGS